ncbi:Kinesin-like protein subito [Eumeta japonica]|uniref:Kinesin-like protein subito n=1 Tax=Eumeta variegata TaxID=151549 RepID=A0A4C1VKZ9_EUMVA|nr:Kinesin-like protein subito [Eumeta japonica]
MENTRSTIEEHCSNEDSDCFRDSYATSLPYRRPQKLNMRKENLLYKFEEEYEIEKPELIQVYLRLKPSDTLNAAYEIRSDKCLVTSMDTATIGHGRRTQQIVKKVYTFSHIFGSDSHQKEIFETVVKTNLQKLSEGHNYTLLTYGASGSGKTYTLMGTKAAPGLIPRSLEYLFHIVEASQSPYYRPCDNGAEKLNTVQLYQELMWVEKLRQVSAPARKKYRRMSANLTAEFSASTLNLSNRVRYYIWVSFIEIYNEVIYDLLVPPESRTKLYIMSDSNGQEYVKGAKQAFVRSGEEAHDVLVAGRHNLRVASTGVNAQSSRSHCIFTITMITETVEGVQISRMRLCDLAGSERANRTHNKGARMAESGAINSSLHVLERCLRTLRKNQKQRQPENGFVPYRQSKLTRLLCSGLSGLMRRSLRVGGNSESGVGLCAGVQARASEINNTVIESTLESTGSHLQDTIGLDEVEKLRSDNERLYFELAQRESESKELRALLERRRLESAELMQRLVKEAKDMTHEYHVAVADSLKQRHAEEMDSIKQKTAAKVKQLASENAQPLTENARLREQLAVEKEARMIDFEELQYLRSLIEEADQEKQSSRTTPKPKDYELMLSESEKDDSNNCSEDDEPLQNTTSQCLAEEKIHRFTGDDIGDADSRMSSDSVASVSGNEDIIDLDSDGDITHSNAVNRSGVAGETDHIDDLNTEDVTNVSCIEDVKVSPNKDDESVSNADRNENSSLPEATNARRSSKQTCSGKETVEKNSVLPSESVTMILNRDIINRPPERLQTEFENSTVIKTADLLDNKNACLVTSDQWKQCFKTSNMENERENKSDDCGFETTVDVQCENANNIAINDDGNETLDHFRQKGITNNDIHKSLIQTRKESLDDIERESDNSKGKDEMIKDYNDGCNLRHAENGKVENLDTLAFITYNIELLTTESISITNVNADTIFENRHTTSPETTKNVETFDVGKSDDSCNIRCTILNSSLAQFERFESVVNEGKNREDVDNFVMDFKESHTSKEKKTYFDNLDSDNNPQFKMVPEADFAEKIFVQSSTTEETNVHNSSNSAEIKIFRNNISESKNHFFLKPKSISCLNKHDSVDIFEEVGSPLVKCEIVTREVEGKKEKGKAEEKTKPKFDTLEDQPEITTAGPLLKNNIDTEEVSISFTKRNTAGNNTTEEFENLYRDVSNSNISEFNALMTHENIDIEDKDDKVNTNNEVMTTVNAGKDNDVGDVKSNGLETTLDLGEAKAEEDTKLVTYNLREKSRQNTHNAPKYNLRLRRQKNLKFEVEPEDPNKLQDIANLQRQFSDVTLDIPAEVKPAQDITFLDEELREKENYPLETQSCPQKSITRSRRKLYTPREPLEDSFAAGESDERVKILRPSYHKGRARRRL